MHKYRYILKIDTNDNAYTLEIGNNLIDEAIRNDLGCSFEIVHPKGLSHSYNMLVDGEGVLKGLDINNVGSYLYGTHEHGVPIVGPIYIVRSIEGEFFGLSEKDVLDFKERFNKAI